VSSRALSSEAVVKTLVLSLGALWHVGLFVQPATEGKPGRDPSKRVMDKKEIQSIILAHILQMLQALMDVALQELNITFAATDLAQKISATFRRMLSSLRIASKWLKANVNTIGDHAISFHSSTESFWATYANFATKLFTIFPPDELPVLKAPLEEDLDMKGFSPLKRGMNEVLEAEGRAIGLNQVHPNDEQLMRIGDLLADAQLIAEDEVCIGCSKL